LLAKVGQKKDRALQHSYQVQFFIWKILPNLPRHFRDSSLQTSTRDQNPNLLAIFSFCGAFSRCRALFGHYFPLDGTETLAYGDAFGKARGMF
jgi:hypothetical protein